MHARDQVWAFDVDGTLIGSIRSGQLRPGVHELFDLLHARGVRCVLWSAGGGDYAQRMATDHGIAHRFAGFYSKQHRGTDGRFDVGHFAAADVPGVFVDDAPNEVPEGTTVIPVPQFMGGNPADQGLWAVITTVVAQIPERRAAESTG